MFSCVFCEISKNTFFTEHLWTTASGRRYFKDLTLHNKTSVVNRSVNYAEVVEFNYLELIYYKGGVSITKWGNFIKK